MLMGCFNSRSITGSITPAAAYCLRAICEYVQARVVIEIGTFIGTSALAMAAAPRVEAIYTCDASNDCLAADAKVRTFPKQTSTQMLERLRTLGVRADLCFFDGVVSATDAILLRDLTHPWTVYVFDDYEYGPKLRKGVWMTVPRKGIGNVALMHPQLPHHRLVKPGVPETMLAVLVPEGL